MEERVYPACTRELYESEIVGEQIFLALVAQAKSPRERYHFATLLQLESETKARLRPLLYRHGVSLDEGADRSLVDLAVAAHRDATWRDFMALNVSVVSDFLARFEAIAQIGDAEDTEVLESMIAHEAAILRWVTMESAGETEGSLDEVVAQLRFPVPVPASQVE